MKSLHKVFVVSLLIALVLTACGPKAPANHYAAIQEAGKIVFATSADFPPFEYVDENGEMAGFDVELMYQLGEELGLEVEIQDMPFDSLIASLCRKARSMALWRPSIIPKSATRRLISAIRIITLKTVFWLAKLSKV